MKRILLFGALWAVAWLAARAADEKFSGAVRPADFSAAGLTKLSPEELARLDTLVRDYKSGALLAATRDAATAERGRAAAEAKVVWAEAAKSEAEAKAKVAGATEPESAKKSGGGILTKTKVLLTPGTEVEYAATDSRIAGDFTGWEGRAIITLENGQRWQIANGGSYYSPTLTSPKVKVLPAALGAFWMSIEGVSQRVKVVPLVGGK